MLLPEWLRRCDCSHAAVRSARARIEKSPFEKIPGYALFRSLTQRMSRKDEESAWKRALVEIEEALVPPQAAQAYG